jgi:hypothetical protein
MIWAWVLTRGEGDKPGICPLPWVSGKPWIWKRNKCIKHEYQNSKLFFKKYTSI